MNKKNIPLYFSLFIFGLIFPPMYLIYIVWGLQKHFPKLRSLYLSFVLSVIFVTIEIIISSWLNISFQYKFLDRIFTILNYPGYFLTKIFLEPTMDSLPFMLLSYIICILFYTFIIYMINLIMSIVKYKDVYYGTTSE